MVRLRQPTNTAANRNMSASFTTDGMGAIAFVRNSGFLSIAISGIAGIVLLNYLGGAASVIGVATATETATDTILSCVALHESNNTRMSVFFRNAAGATVDVSLVAVQCSVIAQVV